MRGIIPAEDSESEILNKNVFNDVELIKGVEADVLDEEGNICATNSGIGAQFIILSVHSGVYTGRPEKITEALIAALEKNRIDVIGHPYASKAHGDLVDMKRLCQAANAKKVPLEVNGAYFIKRNAFKVEQLKAMLLHAERIMVNSDSHTLHSMSVNRKTAFEYLRGCD